MKKPKLKFTETPNSQREISIGDKVCGNCKWGSNDTFDMTLRCLNTNSTPTLAVVALNGAALNMSF